MLAILDDSQIAVTTTTNTYILIFALNDNRLEKPGFYTSCDVWQQLSTRVTTYFQATTQKNVKNRLLLSFSISLFIRVTIYHNMFHVFILIRWFLKCEDCLFLVIPMSCLCVIVSFKPFRLFTLPANWHLHVFQWIHRTIKYTHFYSI